MATKTKDISVTFVPNNILYTGVQFTGKNSKEVANWIEEQKLLENKNGARISVREARAGGAYVRILTDHGEELIMRKGDWFVILDTQHYMIFPDYICKTILELKKKPISDRKAKATLNS